ncbi:hypothetical protein [Kitasatospora sp. SUK 42]|uniref:hypothetical protein n=1 Tax=Kitasatospora sp. SUK 42 TaxID=1588882 RepID=UPI0018CA6460|nr:hypothetical protein [Kitasatospora sp. SUK 42]MBV2154110.1 hypothetical protein [Kitasatospora sp. SUK 42]
MALCGPERDPEFFKDLAAVFASHPDAARRYTVKCLRYETEVLKVDFDKQVGVSHVEGDRVVTEFRARDEVQTDLHGPYCCEWIGTYPNEQCVHYCEL